MKKMIFPGLLVVLSGIMCLFSTCRKSDYFLEEVDRIIVDDGSGIGTVTWTADKTYLLNGFNFVNDGQTLTIEPGTVIRGKSGQGENASALIVARGGKIIAQGTPDNPIIFTAEEDDLKGSVPLEARGMWGGVIILGNAPILTESGEASVEGIPFYEPRGIYGGYTADDNSGVLTYVSIRHGGSNIGEGNEINGLTLAGVGSGTEIDYIEIIANEDDGLEIFGGTVAIRHVLSAFCGDDAFDYDLGYAGKGQFLVGVQKEGLGDRLFENGGNSKPGEETSHPVFYNLTLFGQGIRSGKPMMSFLDNAGGEFYNSVFVHQGKGVEMQKIEHTRSSFDQWKQGNVQLEYSWFFDIGSNMTNQMFYLSGGFSQSDQDEWSQYFLEGNNQVQSAGLKYENEQYFLTAELVEWGTNKDYIDPWFSPVSFKGAFGTVNWAKGWTLFDSSNLFGEFTPTQ